MEKPMYVADLSHRNVRLRERVDGAVRLQNRMGMHGAPLTEDRDGDRQVWRGDHTFSTEAASYSLANFIEPEVRTAHPDWTHDQVYRESVQRFEKRLQQDLSYERKETEHHETTVNWQVIETSPGVRELATRYGDDFITLRELWDHTKEFAERSGNPASFNAGEASAQLAMQDEIIRGTASGYVTVLSHPDSIRYVQVWEKADTGEVVSKQLDLFAATGRDFTPTEGEALVAHIATFYAGETKHGDEGDARYAHYTVRSGQISESDIKTIAIAQSVTIRETVSRMPESGRRTTSGIARTVVRDSAQTGGLLVDYLSAYIHKKFHPAPPDRTDARTPSASVKKSDRQAAPRIHPKEKTMHTAVKHTKRPFQEKGQDYPSHEPPPFIADWFIARTVAEIAPHVPVGPVAFIFLVTEQTRPAGTEMHEPAISPKGSVLRIVEHPLLPDQKDPHRWLDQMILVWELLSGYPKKDGQGRHEALPDDQQVIHTIENNGELGQAIVFKLTRLLFRLSYFFHPESDRDKAGETRTPDADERLPGTPVTKPRKPLMRLRFPVFLGRLSDRQRNNPPVAEVALQDRQQRTDAPVPEQITRVLGRLTFAYILWLVVRRPAPMILQRAETEAETGHTGQDTNEDETPWIMLSIIRQLAMIREQGKVVTTKRKHVAAPKRAGKRSIKRTLFPVAPFPVRGIIFTYAS